MDFMALLEKLRETVATDGRSQGAIARAAKIHRTTFSAFMHGRRGLSIETVEQLAKALGFELKLVHDESKPARLQGADPKPRRRQ